MPETPEALLGHPAVLKTAPWCRQLDPFELAVVLSLMPQGFGRDASCAELLVRVSEMGGTIALGKAYFQRVNRTVGHFVKWRIAGVSGRGTRRAFHLRPEGFAALVLNVRRLDADPTNDPSEFELKREVVTVWALMLDQLKDLPAARPPPVMLDFLEHVDELTVGRRRILTPDVIEETFDIFAFIGRQRRQVESSLTAIEGLVTMVETSAVAFQGVDLRELVHPDLVDDADAASVLEVAAQLMTTRLPSLVLRARALRYRRYLDYLDDLVGMYGETFKGVDLGAYRRFRDQRAG